MIPIVLSTDHKYVMHTGVCILSLLECADKSIYDIYVIVNDDVTDRDKQELIKQASLYPDHKIGFITIGDEFKGCNEVRGISTATYSRLLIPWLLPEYDKVIFSDVDVIFRIDLASVYNLDISGYYSAAIPAIGFRMGDRNIKKYISQLNLDANEYCNAGFLVINSKLQREDNLKPLYLAESAKKYTFQDQDIINVVCKGRLKHISPKYCVTPIFYKMLLSGHTDFEEFYESRNLIEDYKQGRNCILHYAGEKPWNAFTFAWCDWWDTYRKSIFYNPDFEISVSEKILKPSFSWRKIASIIKHKIR